MTQTTTLERLLLDDLDVEGERAADERFCTALYRALTRNVWRNDRDPEGELSPSFQRAEWLRERRAAPPRPGPRHATATTRSRSRRPAARARSTARSTTSSGGSAGRTGLCQLTATTPPTSASASRRRRPTTASAWHRCRRRTSRSARRTRLRRPSGGGRRDDRPGADLRR